MTRCDIECIIDLSDR